MRICETCRYFDGSDGEERTGRCRRHAPNNWPPWPIVMRGDWCGEYDGYDGQKNGEMETSDIGEGTVSAASLDKFERDLARLINNYSVETLVDMPDYLLAAMIRRMIEAIGPRVRATLDWHECDSVCHPKGGDGGQKLER